MLFMVEQQEFDKQIGGRIRRERTLRGWSLQAMAAKVGISYQQLQKYERGLNSLSGWRMARIARVLEVPTALLLGDDTRDYVPGQEKDAIIMLKLFGRLSPKERRAVTNCARALAEDDMPRGVPSPSW